MGALQDEIDFGFEDHFSDVKKFVVLLQKVLQGPVLSLLGPQLGSVRRAL